MGLGVGAGQWLYDWGGGATIPEVFSKEELYSHVLGIPKKQICRFFETLEIPYYYYFQFERLADRE